MSRKQALVILRPPRQVAEAQLLLRWPCWGRWVKTVWAHGVMRALGLASSLCWDSPSPFQNLYSKKWWHQRTVFLSASPASPPPQFKYVHLTLSQSYKMITQTQFPKRHLPSSFQIRCSHKRRHSGNVTISKCALTSIEWNILSMRQ